MPGITWQGTGSTHAREPVEEMFRNMPGSLITNCFLSINTVPREPELLQKALKHLKDSASQHCCIKELNFSICFGEDNPYSSHSKIWNIDPPFLLAMIDWGFNNDLPIVLGWLYPFLLIAGAHQLIEFHLLPWVWFRDLAPEGKDTLFNENAGSHDNFRFKPWILAFSWNFWSPWFLEWYDSMR